MFKRNIKEKVINNPLWQEPETELSAFNAGEPQEVKAEPPEEQHDVPVLTYKQKIKQEAAQEIEKLHIHLTAYYQCKNLSEGLNEQKIESGKDTLILTLNSIHEAVKGKGFAKEIVAFIRTLNASFDQLLRWDNLTQALRDKFYLRNIQATNDFVEAYLQKMASNSLALEKTDAPLLASAGPITLAGGATLLGVGVFIPPLLVGALAIFTIGGVMTIGGIAQTTRNLTKENQRFMETLSRHVQSLIKSAQELGFLPEDKDWYRLADKFTVPENTPELREDLETRTEILRPKEDKESVKQNDINPFVERPQRYTPGLFKTPTIQIELQEETNDFSLLAVGKNHP